MEPIQNIYYGLIDYDSSMGFSNENGKINILFEEVDGELKGIDSSNPFCKTGQVFVTKDFDKLCNRFPEGTGILKVEAIESSTYDPENERSCRYVTSGLVGNRVSKADKRNLPIQVIDLELNDDDYNPAVPEDDKYITGIIALFDEEKSQYSGPWSVIDNSGNDFLSKKSKENGCYRIEPANLFKKDANNVIRKLDSEILQSDDFIVTEFLQWQLKKKYGVLKFIKNKEVFLAVDGEIYPTISFIGHTIKNFLEKRKVPLVQSKKHWSYLAEILIVNKNELKILTDKGFDFVVESLQGNQEFYDVLKGQIEDYIRSEEGQSLAQIYIENNFESFLSKKQKDEVKERAKEIHEQVRKEEEALNRVKELVNDAKEERSKITREIQSKQKELDELSDEKVQNTQLEEKLKDLKDNKQQELIDLDEKIEQLTVKKDKLAKQAGIYEDLDDAEQRKKDLDSHLRVLAGDAEKKEKRLEELNAQIEDKENKLLDKINEIAPHIHAILRGKRNKEFQPLLLSQENIILKNKLPEMYKDEDEPYASFATGLCLYIVEKLEQEYQRNYSVVFVANLMISIQTSFLTFIHGKPGIGKTSVMRILKEILNLNNHFLEVNVAKGWSSERDWIGFHNALQDEFVPSRTGVYNYLKTISDLMVNHSVSDIASPWVLLDEANLSVMEHYWSQFNGMADEESNRVLTIDGNMDNNDSSKNISIHKDMRFIGTINDDYTTQPLSERIISRACVIPLSKNVVSSYYLDTVESTEGLGQWLADSAISIDLMSRAFNLKGDQAIKSDVNEMVANFVRELNNLEDDDSRNGGKFEISERTSNKINSYTSSASIIFNRLISLSSSDESTAQLIADFVLAQFVIPNIRMEGEASKDGLTRSKNFCKENELLISTNLLDEILVKGVENLNQFGLFNG